MQAVIVHLPLCLYCNAYTSLLPSVVLLSLKLHTDTALSSTADISSLALSVVCTPLYASLHCCCTQILASRDTALSRQDCLLAGLHAQVHL